MAAERLRRIRVGLLGLGTVGQAVVRAAARASRDGLAVSVDCALVRDAAKRRRVPAATRVTDNVEAFLRGRYDVVIDALVGREPAATIAARVLGKGTPVVSANKSMLAFDAPRLRRVAARASTTLGVEAAAIAGVPFIGTLERRPLAGRIDGFTGILNGTSNFVLSALAAGVSMADALSDAQARGYAEPNPAADISGADTRDKVVVLASALLGASIAPEAVPVDGIADLTPADLAAASRLGGAIKPLGSAARAARGIAAFSGPAWIPRSHPLAGIGGVDNGIAIEGRHIPRLLFAGPGAGPDVTAATLIDDAVEAVEGKAAPRRVSREGGADRVVGSDTGRFVRVEWRGASRDRAGVLGADDVARVDAEELSWVLVPARAAREAEKEAAALAERGAAVRVWRAFDV